MLAEAERPVVGILVGSASDLPVMEQATAILERFGIPHELLVISAHRNPDSVDEYSRTAEERGLRVLICGAGLAAPLAGRVAAPTSRPGTGGPVGRSSAGGGEASTPPRRLRRAARAPGVRSGGAR